ncbi:L-threonylcarbamoyladenylate synthase [Rarobacter incanus]|uniref:L-threonylcarbamoyladenylate synthase n=1 Tax=Rarobacter incanus TaxID=153494 RepID=A0A542SRH0_9MICO|nr:L-threonylcarbamoyladenylate synthase [Rarobacter incanus]TQK77194.1 translation factor SUA5 [Rarobacter incanus]
MTNTFAVQDPGTWGPSLDAAVATIARGDLVVLPTDTVYGVGADPFDPRAVARLLAAKGRGRQMPPPVLVANESGLDALADQVPDFVRALVAAFWPGGLTVICSVQPSLAWDLGETRGTVALRMPNHPAALALLTRTGPLAVSSANLTGHPAALTCADAQSQLGDSIGCYLDGGSAPGQIASTIVDATGGSARVVRLGAIDVAALEAVIGSVELAPGVPANSSSPANPSHGPEAR